MKLRSTTFDNKRQANRTIVDIVPNESFIGLQARPLEREASIKDK